MRIDEHLYLVGGGDYGFNLSRQFDCNIYIVDTGAGLWMIDAGFDGAAIVVENIRRDGLDANAIVTVYLTHYHADHAGAVADLRTYIGGHVEVAIANEAAPAVRNADERVTGLKSAKACGLYPAEFVWKPTSIEQELDDNYTQDLGGFRITAVRTDGHCRGHMCFLVQGMGAKYLFAGDHVFWGGRILIQNVTDSSVQEYAHSMNRLLDYEFESLLPGHLAFSMRNGKRHVDVAAAKFNRLGLPENLVLREG